MASARKAIDSRTLVPDSIHVSFLPDSENISQATIDRGIGNIFRVFILKRSKCMTQMKEIDGASASQMLQSDAKERSST